MFAEALLALVCAAPQGQSNAPVVINEFSYDDSGALDDREFIELYNRSGQPRDISNWVVEHTTPTGPINPQTIPPGTILPAGAYYVIGTPLVPNTNQQLNPGTNALYNENAALTLKDNNGAIIDTVFYEANKGVFNTALAEGEGIWGNFTNIDGLETTWSRVTDGFDTDDNGCDFRLMVQTSGASNNQPPFIGYAQDFDGLGNGTPVPQFLGSFATPKAIDPTVVDGNNPNAIPVSPQGGLASIWWDPAGGGNAHALISDTIAAAMFEAYVYIDGTPAVGTDIQAWSVGFGTCGTFYNLPDPDRTLMFTANGNVGVTWTLVHTNAGTVLYLIDHNNGGTDFRVLGSIPIQQGVNDGWQRLRLQVSPNVVEGRFGGTFGVCDGVAVGGRHDACAYHSFFVGYREFYITNAQTRPFTCDQMRLSFVQNNQAAAVVYGTATANTAGTPRIGVNGMPCIANPGFRISSSGMKPNALGALAVGATALNFPLTALGGPPGSVLLVNPALTLGIAADGNGDFGLTFRPPGPPGSRLFVQLFEVDLALGVRLPLAHTEGLDLQTGL